MSDITTYQDLLACGDNKTAFVEKAISDYKKSLLYRIALDADEYDHQRNPTITHFVRELMGAAGEKFADPTVSNYKIISNFFHRLNTQRNMYSVGNGLTFPKEAIKKRLGEKFDTNIKEAGYKALIHAVSYLFWNVDRLHVFSATEFCPFWDEITGELAAGIRFWQLSSEKPMYVVLYEADGYTEYKTVKDKLVIVTDKQPYKKRVQKSVVDGEQVIGGENYGSFPIVPLWGSSLRQSTLVGMQHSIDSYDLIRSGFANDLSDCAQIYWLIKNAGGMDAKDLKAFRSRLLFQHIATVDGDSGVDVEPYVQNIPYAARAEYLDRIRSGIYEDFGGLDVHTVAAGATNDHIDAAYQPLDEQADDYEYQIIECVRRLLALQGITGEDAVPTFKRNRISNQREQVEIVMMEATYLDDETILNKLPNISPDEVKAILDRKDEADQKRMAQAPPVVVKTTEKETPEEGALEQK